jgi:hypothetical protein
LGKIPGPADVLLPCHHFVLNEPQKHCRRCQGVCFGTLVTYRLLDPDGKERFRACPLPIAHLAPISNSNPLHNTLCNMSTCSVLPSKGLGSLGSLLVAERAENGRKTLTTTNYQWEFPTNSQLIPNYPLPSAETTPSRGNNPCRFPQTARGGLESVYTVNSQPRSEEEVRLT